MIAIVDYGAGNISSVKKALEHLGAGAQVTSDPAVIAAAEKIVVPGVGHFSRCQSLNEQLRAPVLDAIKQRQAVSRHLRGHAVALCRQHRSAGNAGCGTLRRANARASLRQ